MAAELTWKRSTYSNSDGSENCVECAGDGRFVWIRDAKDPRGRQLRVSLDGWSVFVILARS